MFPSLLQLRCDRNRLDSKNRFPLFPSLTHELKSRPDVAAPSAICHLKPLGFNVKEHTQHLAQVSGSHEHLNVTGSGIIFPYSLLSDLFKVLSRSWDQWAEAGTSSSLLESAPLRAKFLLTADKSQVNYYLLWLYHLPVGEQKSSRSGQLAHTFMTESVPSLNQLSPLSPSCSNLLKGSHWNSVSTFIRVKRARWRGT